MLSDWTNRLLWCFRSNYATPRWHSHVGRAAQRVLPTTLRMHNRSYEVIFQLRIDLLDLVGQRLRHSL